MSSQKSDTSNPTYQQENEYKQWFKPKNIPVTRWFLYLHQLININSSNIHLKEGMQTEANWLVKIKNENPCEVHIS